MLITDVNVGAAGAVAGGAGVGATAGAAGTGFLTTRWAAARFGLWRRCLAASAGPAAIAEMPTASASVARCLLRRGEVTRRVIGTRVEIRQPRSGHTAVR